VARLGVEADENCGTSTIRKTKYDYI
jgi:hypothetical protein